MEDRGPCRGRVGLEPEPLPRAEHERLVWAVILEDVEDRGRCLSAEAIHVEPKDPHDRSAALVEVARVGRHTLGDQRGPVLGEGGAVE